MRIGLRAQECGDEKLRLARQLGVNGCSFDIAQCPGYVKAGYVTVDTLKETRERLERYGLQMAAFTVGSEVLKNQLCGHPERKKDVDNVCRTIKAMGEVYSDSPPEESPVLIIDQQTTRWNYDFTGARCLPIGPGGALLFRRNVRPEDMDGPCGEVSATQVWDRMAYLYERIIPVAEECGIRLATHPDDPPLDYYRGVHQVLTGLAGLAEFIERFPSPNNGLLLCLGCMAEAGEDVQEVIRFFGSRKKIFYVHFRNVGRKGSAGEYDEVYPDEGDTDMRRALFALAETGYTRYLVPDHHFGLDGDNDYFARSWAFQVGYIRGLMQGAQVKREQAQA
ncbi:MAG: mannonate dehydratase [Planctomycetota bacterium]|jgi:mannonate dehydratase